MADTISLGMDVDDAVKELDRFVDEVGSAEKATDGLAKSGEAAMDAQERQITVIHRQATEWKTLAAVAVPAIGEVTVAGIHLAEKTVEIGHGFQSMLFDIGRMAAGSIFRMAEISLVAGGTVSAIKAFRGSTVEATKATQEGAAANVEYAGSLSGIGTQLAILTVGTIHFTGQWKNLGKGIVTGVKLGTGALARFGPSAASAAAQTVQKLWPIYGVLTAMKTQFEAWNFVMARTGARTDEFGKMTSNYDRVSTASARLKENLYAMLPSFKAVEEAGGTLISQTATQMLGLAGLAGTWKEVDRAMTATADQQRENIILLANYISAAGDLERANARLEKQREAEREHFDRLRSAQQELAGRSSRQQESDRFGGIGRVAGSQDDANKAAGLKSVDAEIEAQNRAAKATADALALQKQNLDGSLRAEKEYAEAVMAGRKSMEENRKEVERLITKRKDLAAIPAGANLSAAFAKQSEFERQAIAEIDEAIRAMQRRAGEAAKDQNFSAEAKAQMLQQTNELLSRRDAVETASRQRQWAEEKAFRADVVRIRKESEDQMFDLYRERLAKEKTLRDRETALIREVVSIGRDFQNEINLKVLSDAEEVSRHKIELAEKEMRRRIELRYREAEESGKNSPEQARLNELAKERELYAVTVASEEKIRQEAYQASLTRLSEETKQKLRAIDSELEFAKRSMTNLEQIREADQAAQMRRLRVLGDAEVARRRAEIKLADDTQKAKRAIAEREVDAEREKQEAIKKMQADLRGKAGIDGKAILAGQPKAKVRADYVEAARQKAAADYSKKNQKLLGRASTDPKARAAYEQRRKKAMADAARKAATQFNRGKADPAAVAQSQANVANKTIGAMRSQGKLNGDLAQSLATQVQTAANMAATSDAHDAAIKDLQKAQAAILKQSTDTRQRAQASGGRG